MRPKRKIMPSDILILLSVPGLLMGLVTLLIPKSGPGTTMDYVLWEPLRLAGYAGLAFVALAIVAAVIEHFVKARP